MDIFLPPLLFTQTSFEHGHHIWEARLNGDLVPNVQGQPCALPRYSTSTESPVMFRDGSSFVTGPRRILW